MPYFLHRTTKQSLESRSPNKLPEPIGNYIMDPDLSAVVGFPSKYWVITGDIVTLMDQAARDAVDAAEAAALVTEFRAEATAAPDATDDAIGWETRALIQLLNTRDNFLTTRIIQLQDRVQAMLDSSGNVASMRTAGLAVPISATATRTRADAVQDYKDDIASGNADT